MPEICDNLPATPADLSTRVSTIIDQHQREGVCFPVSGDVIATGLAEWERELIK